MGASQKRINQGIATRTNILSVISQYCKEYGFSPTVREIAALVGLKSSSSVHNHLEILKKEGKIFWNPAMPRTIRILNED